MRVAVVSNTAWYLFNFRRNLMRALQQQGHVVVAVAPEDEYVARLNDHSLSFRHVPISGMGTNPLREIRSVLALRRVFREEQADVVLSYTPKGNLYSAMACVVDGRPFVPNVSGLGRVFIQPGPVTHVVRNLYRLLFRRAHRVLFQNRVDLELFVSDGMVPDHLVEHVPGSGVDLAWFSERGNVAESDSARDATGPVFLMVARAMWDKGLGEFVEAARAVRAEHPQARFQLLGALGVDNPAAVPREVFDGWISEGVIEYLGTTDDVRPFLSAADCVVLPSYREGVSRVLLEAGAMSRPIITTDAPGCRDVVVEGQNGFMCRARDASDLASAMRRFLALSPERRREMGAWGRTLVEQNFDERNVIARYIDIVSHVCR